MPIPTLETCFCGCTLQMGTLIILWMFVVGGGLTFLLSIDKLLGSYYMRFGLYELYPWFDSISGIAMMITGIMGVHGVKWEKSTHLLLFLLCCGSLIIVEIIQSIFLFINWWTIIAYVKKMYNLNEATTNFAYKFIYVFILFFLISNSFAIYCVLVVFSYYKTLTTNLDQQRRHQI